MLCTFFFKRNSFIFIFYLFIYLFLAVLGLCFCARAFSSCGKRGPLFIAVRRPLIIAASSVAEHRLQTRRLSSCGSWAQLLRGMWDLPRPGLQPVSPALAGRFSTTAPPGKPLCTFYACKTFPKDESSGITGLLRVMAQRPQRSSGAESERTLRTSSAMRSHCRLLNTESSF